MHEGGEIEFDGVFGGVMVVNKVVDDGACVIVHGFEEVGGGDDEGYFLGEVLSVFDHVAAFVDGLLDEVEFLDSA